MCWCKISIFVCTDKRTMRSFLIIVFLLTHLCFFAQISDNFTDGDFSSNPVWSGSTTDFIVNPSFQLQTNAAGAGTSYLTTPHGLVDLNDKEWKLWVRQAFSPSSSNFGRVYLTSSSADLTTNPDGFYIQLGEAGSNDAVRLFKSESGVDTELIAGTAGEIASSFSIGIRVVRDNTGNWTLEIDASGGENYAVAGTINDGANLLGTHFGCLATYTASNATKFYYDSIYVGDEILDLTAPQLQSAVAISTNQIDVQFDEALDQTSAETLINYTLNPSVTIASVVLDALDPTLVHLNLSGSLTNGQSYDLTTDQISDLALNVSGSQTVSFAYLISETPEVGDVIINEFICDPSPVVGLPEVEYVEIYNRSSKIMNVQDWRLGDASSLGTITDGWLLPNEYMLLTSTSNVDSFTVATGVTSFPSLNNSGDAIVLKTSTGIILDTLNYTTDWYVDPTKEDGGYSIERINVNDPCSDQSNWRASNDLSGGTPGVQNSVFDTTPDTDYPMIDQLVALAPNFLEVHYSEGMDSTSLKDASFVIDPTLTIANNYVLESYPDMHILEFNENIISSEIYQIEIQNVADCWSNTTSLIGSFALPAQPEKGDLVINEILFSPYTGGSDWVEIYNNSTKVIDLKDWEIADYDTDSIGNNKIIQDHFLLFPDEYVVLTEDSTQLIQDYSSAVPGRFIQMDLPSYTNDSSTVYLIYSNQVMDQVSYTSDWHFQLLDDTKGVSIERIDPNGASNNQDNWHSGAEAVGFATPGGQNSQYYPSASNGDFNYSSETISPDNDGFEDVLQINYQMLEAGYIGTFKVYDDRGRYIATVTDSELLGTSGTLSWDGITNDGLKASIGAYVGVFEAFDINGGQVVAKVKAFVVAGNI